MSKEAQISIKLETSLRDQFMEAAANIHRPAAQIIRELMRAFVARQEIPNEETVAAIAAVERNEVNTYGSVQDLYKKLRI